MIWRYYDVCGHTSVFHPTSQTVMQDVAQRLQNG